jgi:two-component system phosphate regulon sensor histidine kinase PhoR
MSGRHRASRGSWRLAALFLAILVPAAATLVGLGLLLLAQDRALLVQRQEEEQQHAADVVVAALMRSLAAARSALDRGQAPAGVVLASVHGATFESAPGNALLWMPTPRLLPEADATPFFAAELSEARRVGDWGLAAYQARAHARDPRVRAAALVRVARVQRAAGRLDDARKTYAELVGITTVALDGVPADFVARRALCDSTRLPDGPAGFRACGERLARELLAGRWSLDYGAWQLAAQQIEHWTGRALPVSGDARALAAAADRFWREAMSAGGSDTRAAGDRVLETPDGPVTVIWARTVDALHALFVPRSVVATWVDSAGRAVSGRQIAVRTDQGAIMTGVAAIGGAGYVRRLAGDTGLPWTVWVGPATVGVSDELKVRQRLLAVGLAAIVLLLAGGGVLIWRVVQRELAIAKLQTDFVAAVSHEFRTPLASLQHVHELLEEDDAVAPERRQVLYGVIGRSTSRLSGLVESLLDFARMEEGRRPYDLRPVDASALIVRAVDEFRRHLATPDVQIRAAVRDRATIEADAPALMHAIWNLLDNAVKYSPRPADIQVSLASRGSRAAISVSDNGPGIPAAEQRDIFGRFVRGADAVRRRIAGTGLGLAIVSHIVAAHHGTVAVNSEVGRGSTFTMDLPRSGAARVQPS